jgi:hypothetical protein
MIQPDYVHVLLLIIRLSARRYTPEGSVLRFECGCDVDKLLPHFSLPLRPWSAYLIEGILREVNVDLVIQFCIHHYTPRHIGDPKPFAISMSPSGLSLTITVSYAQLCRVLRPKQYRRGLQVALSIDGVGPSRRNRS